MKHLIFIWTLLLSLSASADVFSYRLYEDSVDEFTPFILSIEMDGPFRKGAKVTSVTLTEELKGVSTPLFSWDQETAQEVFNFAWRDNGILSMSEGPGQTFKSVVTSEVSNPWGDTSINPEDDYSFYTDGEMLLDRNGVTNSVQFEIANQSAEESCLWGLIQK